MAPKSSSKQPALSPEQLEAALDVKPPLDPQAAEEHVHQLLTRAQVSWLTKRDVLDILSNWQVYNLPISMMPPDQPAGSLFLFDRNQLKSFRRDNHQWKSKAGGKTVQETHEKLKIDGGIPALNCYYAHSADGTLQRITKKALDAPSRAQRRCYWKLAGKTNIVLMHYRAPARVKTSQGGSAESAQPLSAAPRSIAAYTAPDGQRLHDAQDPLSHAAANGTDEGGEIAKASVPAAAPLPHDVPPPLAPPAAHEGPPFQRLPDWCSHDQLGYAIPPAGSLARPWHGSEAVPGPAERQHYSNVMPMMHGQSVPLDHGGHSAGMAQAYASEPVAMPAEHGIMAEPAMHAELEALSGAAHVPRMAEAASSDQFAQLHLLQQQAGPREAHGQLQQHEQQPLGDTQRIGHAGAVVPGESVPNGVHLLPHLLPPPAVGDEAALRDDVGPSARAPGLGTAGADARMEDSERLGAQGSEASDAMTALLMNATSSAADNENGLFAAPSSEKRQREADAPTFEAPNSKRLELQALPPGELHPA